MVDDKRQPGIHSFEVVTHSYKQKLASENQWRSTSHRDTPAQPQRRRRHREKLGRIPRFSLQLGCPLFFELRLVFYSPFSIKLALSSCHSSPSSITHQLRARANSPRAPVFAPICGHLAVCKTVVFSTNPFLYELQPLACFHVRLQRPPTRPSRSVSHDDPARAASRLRFSIQLHARERSLGSAIALGHNGSSVGLSPAFPEVSAFAQEGTAAWMACAGCAHSLPSIAQSHRYLPVFLFCLVFG